MTSSMLAGKSVVVTGSARGIGAAIVEACAAQGANVFACARKENADFAAGLDALSQQYGVECVPLYFDMCNAEAMKEAVKEIHSSKRAINGLVNNAGIVSEPASFVMMDMGTMRQVMETNFFSAMAFTQYMVRLMQRGDGGSIINVSSIAALDGTPGQLDYVVSKGAMIAATKELAYELASDGIRVNAVAPGVIETDMGRAVSEDLTQEALSRSVFHRLGAPKEIASVVAFLLSDESSFLTGQIIRADGGTI